MTAADETLAIYVHWPFCQSKCPYCDFNSHVAETIDEGRWRAAILRELDHFALGTKGRTCASLFFGGGTPSLLSPRTVAAIIEHIAASWPLADDFEATLEANPSSAEAGRFAAYREAGINRLSIGVQSFDDRVLSFLGRRHSADEARRAIGAAALVFPRFSFDLIYALPGQNPHDWFQQMDEALSFTPNHLSVYQLTIEPGTPFARDRVVTADEVAAEHMYATTTDRLTAAGLPAYEISNHARPGDECRHNLAYWTGGDYVGVGPGAHGRISNDGVTDAVHQIHTPERWVAAVESRGHGTAKRRSLSHHERAEEMVMTGLRLNTGIDRAVFERRARIALSDVVDEDAVGMLADGDLVHLTARVLRATDAGRLRLNALLARLIS